MKLNILPDNDSVKILYSNRDNYSDDSGFDLVCPDELIVNPRQTIRINFKIKCEAIQNNNYVGYYLYPRSSISRTPLRMSNSVGIIDKGYRGHIMASVDNISNEPYIISKGSRLFQICHPLLEPIDFSIVNNLSESNRGENGFGSTGT